MKRVTYFFGIMLASISAFGSIITVENPCGERFEFKVGPSDTFMDVCSSLQNCFYGSLSLDITHLGVVARAKSPETRWRDYDRPATKSEKEDIRYIVKTLGFESLLSIGTKKSSLKKAGDRVDHLHPFRFLMTIFRDEQMKAGAAAIKTQISWVKNGFFDGIIGSLKEEAGKNNLLAFVEDFAKKIGIDSKLIFPSLKHGEWKEFVNILIDHVPRETDPNRYNM